MDNQVVQENIEGQVKYPDKLPKKRQARAEWSAAISVLVIILVAAWMNSTYSGDSLTFHDFLVQTIVQFGFFILTAFGFELLRRIFYLVEEGFHITGRYDGNWLQLLKELFSFNRFVQFAVAISFPIVLVYYMKSESLPWDRFSVVQFMVIFCAYTTNKLLKIDQSPVMDNILLEQICPLDISSTLASGFCHGYLQLVLPEKGGSEEGLVKRITLYKDSEGLNDDLFPVKKLFVLIPSSTFLSPNFEEMSFGWMEAAKNLKEQLRTRAGVINRSYKNSVYKIQDPSGRGQAVFVVAEGASPLKTLSDVIEHSGEKKEVFEIHKKQIILLFYDQLRKKLKKNRDISDLCELIYYKDIDDHERSNVNVAKLILDRIQDIKQKELLLQRERGESF